MNGETTMSSHTARSSMRRRAALAFGAMVAALAVSAANAALTPVYRFYHLDAGRHFYTASETEKVKVQTTYPRFAYEGVAFYAYSSQDAGTIPVYRFYHQLNGSHVYTASEAEKASIARTSKFCGGSRSSVSRASPSGSSMVASESLR